MSTRKKPPQPRTPLRDQIIDFLRGREEATLKQIAAATTERDYPSRVTAELNRMRTDALIECAKKKGKNELWYWLATPTQDAALGMPQPEVGQNTGSSASGITTLPTEGAAVPEPAPDAATSLSAAPVAEDVPTPPQYDPEGVSLNPACRAESAEQETWSIIKLIGDIRVAIGDPHGKIMLGDLASETKLRLDTARSTIRDLEAQRGHLEQALEDVHAALAPHCSGEFDPSDFSEIELAHKAATRITELAQQLAQAEAALRNATALNEKLDTLLQSARNEAEHLRQHAGGDMVNHPPHYTAGAIECIDAIESALGEAGFAAYCRGNALKYTWRAGLKGDATTDLAKARWYLNRVAA